MHLHYVADRTNGIQLVQDTDGISCFEQMWFHLGLHALLPSGYFLGMGALVVLADVF